MQYRPDIDGLRAVAILPVIVFHSGLHLLPGGFLGVDVFFAISGYLITSVIYSHILSGRFSIGRFYERRIRRLFPALAFMVILVSLFSYLLLLPLQLKQFAASIVPVVGSFSNIYFYMTIGYFSGAAEWMPLLHTWSLGVEEQFYIAFPLMMVVFYRFFSHRMALWLFMIFGIISFITSLYASYRYPSAAFYLIPTRIWEFVVGALAALAGRNSVMERSLFREGLTLIGIISIVFGYLFANSQTPIPGIVAILPVVGATLILMAGHHGTTLVGRCLSLQPFVAIGLISYSLYLWHWPIFVLARIALATIELPVQIAIAMTALSLALSWLSWRFVETPFRRFATRVELFSYSGGALIVCVLIGFGLVFYKGFPGRLPPEVLAVANAAEDVDPLDTSCIDGSVGPKCTFGQKENPKISFAVWGDSFSAAMRPAIAAAMGPDSQGALYWNSGCPALLGARMISDRGGLCPKRNQKILEDIQSNALKFDVVFLVGRWPAWSEGTLPRTGGAAFDAIVDSASVSPSLAESHRVFERALTRTVTALRAMHKKVVLIGMPPEFRADIPTILAMSRRWNAPVGPMTSREKFIDRNAFNVSVLRSLAKEKDVYFVEIKDLFCPVDECAVDFKHRPLFSDADHISFSGAEQFVSPYLKKAFDSINLTSR